ncbi:MAG: glycosyltransferase family 2 protein [Clostridiales bacterium]|nr:glycosyltransferase family 2 protein [Clostridiales bacterium]
MNAIRQEHSGDLVSIITPSYNSAEYISETIESILAQSYKNWELLITDDCSQDRTLDIIANYASKDSRIKFFSLAGNSGAAVARNNSIKYANGRYIAFCDSDDCWYPTKLEEQIQFMQKMECALSYTSYDVINEKGQIIGFVECLKSLSFLQIVRDNSIGCLTAMYDTAKIGKTYMPLLRKRQDWGLWVKIIKNYGKAYGLQKSLGIYRKRTGSISSNKIEMLKYNINMYNKVLKYNKFLSGVLLIGYYMPYYFYKKIKQKISYKKKSLS